MFKTILMAAPVVIVLVFAVVLMLPSGAEIEIPEVLTQPRSLITILAALLFIPLMLLSMFAYMFYQMFIVVVCTLVIVWLMDKIRWTEHPRTKALLRALIVLVIVAGFYNTSARFNFLLSGWARQRVVEKVIRQETGQGSALSLWSIPEFLLLGKATTYIEGDSVAVYFDYYTRPPAQSAFIIYTNNPSSIERKHQRQFSRLGRNWYFLVRGYAD